MCIRDRSNPPTLKVSNPNPPASNPFSGDANAKSMEGMEGSNSKNSKKIKNNHIYRERKETNPPNPPTLQPSIIDDELTVGSAWDTGGDDDDPHWG